MPPDMAINMRRSKLKAEEAALLAGELKKPTWESRNEGIHERVSFEDAIWGFDLAGGSYYKTPLRVVSVKPDSRAAKAGIRPGDRLKRINDIDTSTLTIQEAHKIIIDSGIHLKIAVTAPEDEEDAYYCYEDPLADGYDSEEERRKEEEKARKREVHAKVSSYWSLQWPWVSKRRVIYRESNCFMVPSKYEGKHQDRFTPQPIIRKEDDIVLDSINRKDDNTKTSKAVSSLSTPETKNLTNGNIAKNHIENGNNQIPEINGELSEVEEQTEELTEVSQSDETLESKDNSQDMSVDNSNIDSAESKNDEPGINEESGTNEEPGTNKELSQAEEETTDVASAENSQDDEVINQMLEEDSISKDAEENILDSILSDSEANSHGDER